MEGFEFGKKPMITICGKEYECDPTDIDLIRGTMQDFPRIIELSREMSMLKEQLEEVQTTHSLADVAKFHDQATDLNNQLLEACQAFLFGAIGKKEYEEIFAGRRPNSVDHIALCNYVFRYISDGRAELLQKYMDPPEVEHAQATPA